MKEKRMPDTDLETLMPLLIAAWRRLHKESGPPDVLQTREFRRVVAAVKTFQGKNNEDYFNDPELLGAYCLYQWVLHYQQGLSLINELPNTPKRVLDICSGPLPFAFAALRHGAQEVHALDRNRAALEFGSALCGRYGLPVQIRQWNCLTAPFPLTGHFDLIILGHALTELFPDGGEQQNAFIWSLLEKLTPQGHLLLVDQSNLETNRRILQVRDHLVAKGVAIQAPCVWRGECPALKTKDSPCYAQREFEKPYLIKEIQRAAEINLNSLKMSYIIFKHPKATWPVETSIPVYRVISPPVETFQGKRYYLCGTDGKKTLGSRLKEHPSQSRAFEYLRRGELISVENSLASGQALDIIPGTTITVKAACGKPVIDLTTGGNNE